MKKVIIGVDPGLVHTGLVFMKFDSINRELRIGHSVIDGGKYKGSDHARQVQSLVANILFGTPIKDSYVFIEGYKPRSHFNTDKDMVRLVTLMRATVVRNKVLLNTGVKRVIKQSLMDLLGVWHFTTVTHHQDLRSAARIALLGMVKDDELNRLLADYIKDHLCGRGWRVINI